MPDQGLESRRGWDIPIRSYSTACNAGAIAMTMSQVLGTGLEYLMETLNSLEMRLQ